MKSIFFWLSCGLVLLSPLACTQAGDQLTIVEGTVTNKYSGQTVPDVPITVRRVSGGSPLGGSSHFIDSLTTARTDAAGHYQLSFDGAAAGTYEVRLANQAELFDLVVGYNGWREARRGVKNVFNFDVTPYKTVTIVARSAKAGKTSISFAAVAVGQPAFSLDIFSDTARVNQTVAFTRRIRVVPNRTYEFQKVTFNRVGYGPYNFNYVDYSYDRQTLTAGYNDTTVVNFR